MSDPVTNVEIEDVLSSIRRLVSVDSGRTRRVAGGDAKPDTKLVLTEDYRISPAPVRRETDAEDETVPSEQTATLAEDYTKTLEKRIAELEAAVTAQASEFEPDGSEDTSQHRPTTVLFTPRAEPAPQDDGSDGAVDLDMLVSDLEKDVGLEHAAPQEAEVNHAAMWYPDADDEAAQSPPIDETPASVSQDPQNDDGIEILEAESHRNSRADDENFAFSSDEAIIDEEALRDMVAEIVRQELQGALGERITRNVRKLVRREIMRAISIRDFE